LSYRRKVYPKCNRSRLLLSTLNPNGDPFHSEYRPGPDISLHGRTAWPATRRTDLTQVLLRQGFQVGPERGALTCEVQHGLGTGKPGTVPNRGSLSLMGPYFAIIEGFTLELTKSPKMRFFLCFSAKQRTRQFLCVPSPIRLLYVPKSLKEPPFVPVPSFLTQKRHMCKKKSMIRYKAKLRFPGLVFSGTKCVDTADLSF